MTASQPYQELRRRMTRAVTRMLLHGFRDRLPSTQALPRTAVRQVLVCRPNHRLGNLLLLTPLLTELERLFPAAKIDIVLAGADGAALFRGFDNVRHIYSLSRRMVRHPVHTARIALQIRRTHYDLAIAPCAGSQSARWLTAMAKARWAIVSGGVHPPLATSRAVDAYPAPPHMAKWPVHRLRRAVSPPGALLDDGYPTLDIQLSPVERRRGRQILDGLASSCASLPQVLGIFADASGDKGYPERWWLSFIAALSARAPGVSVVEIAPPDGHSRLSSRFPHFFSPDIREVAAVISQMTCFISADCGVMHLASASGTTTIGLFSVTDAARYMPYGHGSCAINSCKDPRQVAQRTAAVMRAVQAARTASAWEPANEQTPGAKHAPVGGRAQTED